jgi:hypothetical protein
MPFPCLAIQSGNKHSAFQHGDCSRRWQSGIDNFSFKEAKRCGNTVSWLWILFCPDRRRREPQTVLESIAARLDRFSFLQGNIWSRNEIKKYIECFSSQAVGPTPNQCLSQGPNRGDSEVNFDVAWTLLAESWTLLSGPKGK